MKLVVGLGNPGPRYRDTRHNLGFAVLDTLAERFGVRLDREKHQALTTDAVFKGERLILLKPLTFMNLSGASVAAAARNRVPVPEDVLVVVDDVNLPLGRLRLRAGGSAGGHNGLKSIIERLGSDAFHRVRLGVGPNEGGGDLARHVLGRFRPEERDAVNDMVARAADAVETWIADGMEAAMNRHNWRASAEKG